jgi:hypothetical protein
MVQRLLPSAKATAHPAPETHRFSRGRRRGCSGCSGSILKLDPESEVRESTSMSERGRASGTMGNLASGRKNRIIVFTRGLGWRNGRHPSVLPGCRWHLTRRPHGPRQTKPETDDELAELCADICEGRKQPLVFDPEWFRTLIQKNPSDPESWVLKTTYSGNPAGTSVEW